MTCRLQTQLSNALDVAQDHKTKTAKYIAELEQKYDQLQVIASFIHTRCMGGGCKGIRLLISVSLSTNLSQAILTQPSTVVNPVFNNRLDFHTQKGGVQGRMKEISMI